jgi:ABC-2 type transport system permease protein
LTTYPSDIFKGLARALLFSVVPAGFISYLPIGLLRDFSPPFVWGAVFVTLGLTAAGTLLFRFGLRRYTSGNAIAMRG